MLQGICVGELEEAFPSFQSMIPKASRNTKKLDKACIESFRHFDTFGGTLGSRSPRSFSITHFIRSKSLMLPPLPSHTRYDPQMAPYSIFTCARIWFPHGIHVNMASVSTTRGKFQGKTTISYRIGTDSPLRPDFTKWNHQCLTKGSLFHLYMWWNVISTWDTSDRDECEHDTWQLLRENNHFVSDHHREPSTVAQLH